MTVLEHGHTRLYLVTVEVERASGSLRVERVLLPHLGRELAPVMDRARRAVEATVKLPSIVRVLEARRLSDGELPWTLAVLDIPGEEEATCATQTS